RLLQIHSVGDWVQRRTLQSRSRIKSIDFAPSGDWLAAGTRDPGLEIWDLGSDAASRTLRAEGDHFDEMPGFVAFSPDNRLVACAGRGKNIAVFEIATGKLAAELSGHAHAPTAADFAPDGRLVSGGEERTLRLWSIPEQQCLATWVTVPADPRQGWTDQWVGYRASGEFVGSESLDRLVGWQTGGEVYTQPEIAGVRRRVDSLGFGPHQSH
ncbi:MAG: hypothetical protein JNG90_13395, partial [Planctomycetaceae bacterium]|nr:hypothetical protein [Planctomycetaceae bacterium]